MLGSDVGQYDTCGHFCRYCYANTSISAVKQNIQHHDPSSPLLIGHILSDDVIHEAKQEKWRDEQLSLFDDEVGVMDTNTCEAPLSSIIG